jgi:hypothetical protein
MTWKNRQQDIAFIFILMMLLVIMFAVGEILYYIGHVLFDWPLY